MSGPDEPLNYDCDDCGALLSYHGACGRCGAPNNLEPPCKLCKSSEHGGADCPFIIDGFDDGTPPRVDEEALKAHWSKGGRP